MEQHKKYLPPAVFMSSRTYLAIPAKAYTYFLSKLPNRCERMAQAPFQDIEEETMVGYESSWAGVYKSNDLQ